MRAYYIVDRDVALAGGKHFDSFHFVDLPNGQVLMSAEGEGTGHRLFSRHVTAEQLAAEGPIDGSHAGKLAHLGVKKGHTLKEVAQAARAVHRLM